MRRALYRDDDGQPPPGVHADLRQWRCVSELMGFARGIIADGAVNEEEARALRRWLRANPDATVGFPGKQLAERIVSIFEDGVVTDDERESLRELLECTLGQEAGEEVPVRNATRLPLSDPIPTLTFEGQTYVFTGTFYYGSRAQCERAVADRGGRCEKHVTHRTNVVVIGTVASRDWTEPTHGTKIVAAVDFRERGRPIAIVGEEHWVAALDA